MANRTRNAFCHPDELEPAALTNGSLWIFDLLRRHSQ
jgi:hypothetical protein